MQKMSVYIFNKRNTIFNLFTLKISKYESSEIIFLIALAIEYWRFTSHIENDIKNDGLLPLYIPL